jgi:hypothetical protein
MGNFELKREKRNKNFDRDWEIESKGVIWSKIDREESNRERERNRERT